MSADGKRVEITCRIHGTAQTRVSDLLLIRGGMAREDDINATPWFLEVFCSGPSADPCVNGVGGIEEVAALIGDGVRYRTPDGMFRPGPVPTPRDFGLAPKVDPRAPLQFEADPAADGVSTNDYVATLPKRRWSHEAKGHPLFMPRTGMVLTPATMQSNGDWECVVTVGTDTYPTNGHSLWVGREEIESGIDLTSLLLVGLPGVSREGLDAEAAAHAEARARPSFFKGLLDRSVTP